MAWPPVKTWVTEADPQGPPANPLTATPLTGEALTAEFQAAKSYVDFATAAAAQPLIPGRSFRQLLVVGNSYGVATGGASVAGASAAKFRYSLAVARRFGAVEHNIAVDGAFMSYPHRGAAGDGGYADILQGYVPSRVAAPYLADVDAAIVSTGLNDLVLLGAANIAPWTEATRRVIARIRAGAVFEDSDASVTYVGTWTTNSQTARNSGASTKSTTTVGDHLTIAVPSDFPGGEIDLGFVLHNGDTTNASITVDGVAVPGAALAYASTFVTSAMTYTGIVKRLTGLTAGAHTIVVTATAGATRLEFDSWEICASSPPPVAHPTQPRLPTPGVNYQDSDVATLNVAIRALAAEFADGRVVNPDLDSSIGKVAAYFNASGDHPNDRGHQIAAGTVAASLGVALSTVIGEEPAAATPFWHYIGAVNEPAFANGWVNASQVGYPAAGYRREHGRVTLKGLIKTGAAATTAFTLPDGYRPAENKILPMTVNNAGTRSAGFLLVQSDGQVLPLNSGSSYVVIEAVFDAA